MVSCFVLGDLVLILKIFLTETWDILGFLIVIYMI